MKTHRSTIMISEKTAIHIEYMLKHVPFSAEDCMGEDETLTFTAGFQDRMSVDVKVCGVKYREGEDNQPWTEAVLAASEESKTMAAENGAPSVYSVITPPYPSSLVTLSIMMQGSIASSNRLISSSMVQDGYKKQSAIRVRFLLRILRLPSLLSTNTL